MNVLAPSFAATLAIGPLCAAAAPQHPPVHVALAGLADPVSIASALTVVPGGVLIAGSSTTGQPSTWLIDPGTGVATRTRYGASQSLLGRLTAVSRDGTRVVGRQASTSFWADAANPSVVTLIPQFGSSGMTLRAVQRINGETRAVGSAQKPVVFSTLTGIVALDDPTGGPGFGDCFGMSDDGRVLVGFDFNFADAVIWELGANGQYGSAVRLAPSQLDAAQGVSPNGRFVVGATGSFGQPRPTIWDEVYGRRPLRLLELADGSALTGGGLLAAADDGTVVGHADTGAGQRAALWHPTMGDLRMRWFDDFAAAHGLTLPAGLFEVVTVVDDGSDLHFLARTSGGAAHYVRTPGFTSPASPFTVYGAGTGSLARTPRLAGRVASGSGGVGDTVEFVADNLDAFAGISFGLFGFSLAPDTSPPILLDSALALAVLDAPLNATALASGATYTWTVPAAAAGVTLAVQFAGVDVTGQLVFSNGLAFEVP